MKINVLFWFCLHENGWAGATDLVPTDQLIEGGAHGEHYGQS